MSKVFFRYNNKKIERHKPLYFSKNSSNLLVYFKKTGLKVNMR